MKHSNSLDFGELKHKMLLVLVSKPLYEFFSLKTECKIDFLGPFNSGHFVLG